MEIKEAKKIYDEYSSAWENSIKAGYTIVAPQSYLKTSKEDIKKALKIIWVHTKKTKNLSDDKLNILKIGYSNLATFINDTDAEKVSEFQKWLDEFRIDPNNEHIREMLADKNQSIEKLENFIEIQKKVNQEMLKLNEEFTNYINNYGEFTAKLIAYADVEGKACWARFRMPNNDPCWLSVAQGGIVVKKSIIGLFGAELYKETNVYYVGNTAKALSERYSDNLTPTNMRNPVLKAFSNTILHCSDLPEVVHILNSAFPKT
ncbi:MAG: hypothetical protein Q8N22_03190 [bacterium]|nr:hypothetical protein [bacterium]